MFPEVGLAVGALGAVLSTVNTVLVAVEVEILPALSYATPPRTVMAIVPSPVILENVTTLEVVLAGPVIAGVPVAVPVVVIVVLARAKVTKLTEFPSAYVTVYATLVELVIDREGEPIETVGAVLSTIKVVLAGVEVAIGLPAASLAVVEAIVIPKVPLPLMPEMVITLVLVPDPETPPTKVPVAVPVTFSVMLVVASVTVPLAVPE